MSEFTKPYEESALPESSLSELYGQLAQMMRSLERRVLAWDANVVASEENFARFERFLDQKELHHEDLQEFPPTSPQSLPMTPAPMAPTMPPVQPPREASRPAAPVYMAQPLGQVKCRQRRSRVAIKGHRLF